MARETRFSLEILTEALDRLNAVKDRCEVAGKDGTALLEELGFASLAAHELAIEETAAALAVEDIDDQNRLAISFWDGLMLGALAADISWERSFGLSGATCD